MMDIPSGYVLVKRGGRPPKHARDVAVWLLHHRLVTQEGHKAAAFYQEAISLFGFADDPDVRKSLRKAKRILPRYLMTFSLKDGVFCMQASMENMVPIPGGTGWAWTPGMAEAIPIKCTNGL